MEAARVWSSSAKKLPVVQTMLGVAGAEVVQGKPSGSLVALQEVGADACAMQQSQWACCRGAGRHGRSVARAADDRGGQRSSRHGWISVTKKKTAVDRCCPEVECKEGVVLQIGKDAQLMSVRRSCRGHET